MEVLASRLVLRALTQNYTSHSRDINVPTDKEREINFQNNITTNLDTVMFFPLFLLNNNGTRFFLCNMG